MDWYAGPGFPRDELLQTSHAAEKQGMKIERSAVEAGAKLITSPAGLPYEQEFGGIVLGVTPKRKVWRVKIDNVPEIYDKKGQPFLGMHGHRHLYY